MANELTIRYTTGSTLYAHVLNATGEIWNGAAFEAPQNANWLDYDLAMTEAGTTGYYRVDMPAVAAGAYSWAVLLQAGGAAAVGDVTVGSSGIQWSGTAEVSIDTTAVAALETADAILSRDVANVEDTASTNSLAELLLAAFESAIAAGTWTIYETDHATPFNTRTVTTSGTAQPIVEVT